MRNRLVIGLHTYSRGARPKLCNNLNISSPLRENEDDEEEAIYLITSSILKPKNSAYVLPKLIPTDLRLLLIKFLERFSIILFRSFERKKRLSSVLAQDLTI